MIDEIADYTEENQYHLRRLLGSIEASYGGLNLLVCICDNPYYRDEIVESYEQELGAKGVSYHRVQIDHHQPSLKQSLFNLNLDSNSEQPKIVTVFGIDGLLSVRLEQDRLSPESTNRSEQEKFFFSVQWTREALREFRFPIILWMTESIAGELSQQAPDFWSWRGGVFEFVRSIEIIERDILQIDRIDVDAFNSSELSANPEVIQSQINKISSINTTSPLLKSLYLSLGVAYYERYTQSLTGKNDDLENAISVYQRVIELFPRNAFPEDWAMAQYKLGIAYWKRKDLELAIESYQLALEVFTHDAFPEYWARNQGNLGIAYSDRLQGRNERNLELAIESYQLALEVFTHDAFPEYWAKAQHLLAIAYYYRIQGRKAENLELAIEAYHLALKVYTHQAFPDDWARTRHNLAIAYCNRIQGNKADNLELAIEHYQLALSVYTRKDFPKEWEQIHSILVNVHKDLIKSY